MREPITFYMDHSVPEQWRPLVREATLWWNAAFEQVGVRNGFFDLGGDSLRLVSLRAKLVGVFENNFDLGMHSHNGVVVLFETEHGRPFAIVDAAEITAIRTAAASAMATRGRIPKSIALPLCSRIQPPSTTSERGGPRLHQCIGDAGECL